jgi:hypothetical protein
MSDHFPFIIQVGNPIPMFFLEIFLLQRIDFKQTVENAWTLPVSHFDSAKIITAKFENL